MSATRIRARRTPDPYGPPNVDVMDFQLTPSACWSRNGLRRHRRPPLCRTPRGDQFRVPTSRLPRLRPPRDGPVTLLDSLEAVRSERITSLAGSRGEYVGSSSSCSFPRTLRPSLVTPPRYRWFVRRHSLPAPSITNILLLSQTWAVSLHPQPLGQGPVRRIRDP